MLNFPIQTNHFSSDEIRLLPQAISQPRFGRYLNASNGNGVAALQLYQWNSEISAAFFLPLQMLEVTIRNAIADAAAKAYGPNWTHSNTFMRSFKLPKNQKAFNPREHLKIISERYNVPGKVIADLNFIFWQKMFVKGLDSAIWNPYLRNVFPHLDHTSTVQQHRAKLHDGLDVLRTLRNRIAHHEPIFERDLHYDLHLIDTLIGYRCQHTVNWMRRIEQVSALLARHPLVPAMPQARPA